MSLSSNIKARINQSYKTKKKKEKALNLANELNAKGKSDQTLWDEIQQGMKSETD